jgi:hypothetical protein
MQRFVQPNELVRHARDFVENRVNSLESDAKHCLPEDPNDERIAPFPILLYCFATIDLLGALMSGRADEEAPTTKQSRQYMTNFMGDKYTTENAKILLDLFRHKLVHLAQPNPLIKRGSEVITWRYWHKRGDIHLKKLSAPPGIPIHVTNDWTIPVTHEFHISIMDFVNDIKNSTTKTKGYLDMLEKETAPTRKISRCYQSDLW